MCPRYSFCHRGRFGSPLSIPFYHLLRLHLATGTAELLPAQQRGVEARVAVLWTQWQHAASRLCVPTTRARPLAEQLLAALLRRPCCRRSVREAVPLPAALGPAALLHWVEEAVLTRSHWEIAHHA